MHTYVVYHQKTGKIVHVHNDTGEARKPEDVIRYVHPSHPRKELAAIKVDEGQMLSGKAYRVNPKSKKVETAKAGTHSSAGAGQLKDRT